MESEKDSIEELKQKVSKMSINEMRKISNFSVWQDTDEEEGYIGDGKWYLYESICKLGGCDFNGMPFDTERGALEEAALMSLQGKEPDMSYPCPECYREYLEDCQ